MPTINMYLGSSGQLLKFETEVKTYSYEKKGQNYHICFDGIIYPWNPKGSIKNPLKIVKSLVNDQIWTIDKEIVFQYTNNYQLKP